MINRFALVITTCAMAFCLGACRQNVRALDDGRLLRGHNESRYNPLIGGEAEGRAEILRRGLLTEAEMQRAERHEVQIGDRIEQVYVAWGSPHSHQQFERKEGFVDIMRFIPDSLGPTSRSGTVYMVNGIVTMIER